MVIAGMSNVIFTTVATNQLASQPVATTPIVLRSTSTADTMSATVFGTISAAPGSSAKTLTGKIEVQTSASFTAITQAILASAPAGSVTAFASGTAAIGDIRVDAIPADGATLTLGLVGSTQAYRFKNTLAAAYDVKIGASVADCAANLKAALNADGTPGTEYFAGTLANPYLLATVSTSVVTTTDRIACDRQLEWTFTESASNFAKRVPLGGIDGLALFSFAAGITSAANPLTFSTEDHLTDTLPALMTGTSPSVAIGGDKCMLRLFSDKTITYKIQSTTDLVNFTDTTEGTATLTANTLTLVTLADLHEFIRFVIVTNANTTNAKMDARVIF